MKENQNLKSAEIPYFRKFPGLGGGKTTADSEFNRAIRLIVHRIDVEYSAPEEKILKQNSVSDGSMFVVLNGAFCV